MVKIIILKNNNEKIINLLKYYEILDFADKLRLSINIFESDYIKIKNNKMLEILKKLLKIVDKDYMKYGMINFLEYRHLLLLSAQVMEMSAQEQSMFVDKILNDVNNMKFKKVANN